MSGGKPGTGKFYTGLGAMSIRILLWTRMALGFS